MSSKQSYPSPTAAQASGGPFYSQNSGEPPQIPHDLQQLQAANDSRNNAPAMGSSVPDAEYTSAGGQGMAQPTSPERLAQGVLSMSDQHDISDAGGPRKRTKVSRACDECRRKKIRCDATSEPPEEPCSNCKRTGAHCQFSRQPMKRGPSKGYIKELADRLNTLESQLGPQAPPMHHGDYQYMHGLTEEGMAQRIGELQEFATPSAGGRKRTHSISENASFPRESPYSIPRQSGPWSADVPRHQNYGASGLPHTPQSTAAELNQFSATSGPNLSLSSWRYGAPDSARRDSSSAQYEPDMRDTEPMPLDWDESVVDEYYRMIHPTFPLLTHSKLRLRSRLVNCPATLREAFLTAMDCAVRTNPSCRLQASSDPAADTRKAADLISSSQYESTHERTVSANIIYLQTLVFMAFESDNHGPAIMRGQVGPPRAEWLGRAIGIATHLKLNVPKAPFNEGDPDADDKLGRRVWWILFILDRWHSTSTASLLQLPDNSSSLLPEDRETLGESTYQMARLSFILGHLAAVLQQPSLMGPSSPAAPIISTTILGEIDRFRESIEHHLNGAPNLIHLCYWHVRLLILRVAASTTPHELLTPATRIASLLNSSETMITPLNHHFAALAAMTLLELSGIEETRPGAEKGFEDLVQALNLKKGLMAREDSAGWDGAVRELVARRKSQVTSATPGNPSGGSATVGLQHLADAAIGKNARRPDTPTGNTALAADAGGGTSPPREGDAAQSQGTATFDPTLLTRYGYLAALVQENAASR